jgi:hypothetical protein
MKDRILNIVSKTAWILPVAAILTVGACKKTGYLGYTPGTGAPTITSVHTLTKVDTVNTNDTIIAYNSSGDTTQTIRTTQTTTTAFDSATTSGNLGSYYVIEGSNLGSATTVTFNGIVAYFNRALSTDNSIIVSVPSSTPYIGPQATVGFAAVTAVTLRGTLSGSSSVNFVSQSDTVMTLTFPATTVTRGVLAFAYNSGGTTLTALGNQELVDIDNAYQVFAGGAIAPGWGSWSYDQVEVSNTQAITASTSYQMQYSSNGYKVDGLRYESGTAAVGVTYSPSYTYLVFYVYGGVQTETLYVEFGGGASGGFGNGGGNAINAQTIKPNQWNYFKVPISSLLWNTTATNWAANSSQLLNTVGFYMNSNGNVTEQLYFDDIVLVQ